MERRQTNHVSRPYSASNWLDFTAVYRKLDVVSLEYGYIIPPDTDPLILAAGENFKYGSVYTAADESVLVSQRWRECVWWKGKTDPPDFKTLLRKLDISSPLTFTDGLFGGFMNCHYGHFLVETLPRLWALTSTSLRFSNLIVFCLDGQKVSKTCDCLEMLQTAVDALTAPDIRVMKVTHVSEPVAFQGQLSIPESAWFLEAEDFHPFAARIFQRISSRTMHHRSQSIEQLTKQKPFAFDGLFLLREHETPNQVHKKLATNQEHLAELFRDKMNLLIVDPATLSFKDQVSLISQSRILVGRHGSGMHSCVFLPPGSTVIVIEDDRVINHTQEKLVKLLRLNGVTLPFHGFLDEQGITFNISFYRNWINQAKSPFTSGVSIGSLDEKLFRGSVQTQSRG